MKPRLLSRFVLPAAIAALALGAGCNPIDLRSLLAAGKQPETLLEIEEGEEYVIKFRQLLVSAKELENFGLVPTGKFGDDASGTWVYNVYNLTEDRFLFPVKVECRDGKIAEIRLPGSAAAALPGHALFGYVQALCHSSFDLKAGKTVPDPTLTSEIDCRVPAKAITECIGTWETVRRENNVADYRYALRVGRGPRSADVLLRCAYREMPERLLGADIFVRKVRIGLSPQGAQLTFYHNGYRRTVAAR